MEENLEENAPKLKKIKKERKLGKRWKNSEGWINSLPWNDANPVDCSTVLLGSNEGGFLSLEEIDEDAYNLGQTQTLKDRRKSKKRKRAVEKDEKEQANESKVTHEDDLTQALGVADTAVSSREEEEKTRKKRRKKKKKKMKRKISESKTNKDADNHPEGGHDVDMTDMDIPNALEDASVKDHEEDLSFDVEEISAWKELRLHPLLEKAIGSLRFTEPTPIQKLCIPAAAHQGKDVIGAAETGSGKTLAFGLPILQRLLEEQDKEARKEGLTSKEERSSKGKKGRSPLRALVVTPTRELALQVCDHLKAAAKFTNIRVVPIVGGIATQKQERFLKQKPQIVVGTPGRLWELMAGGERHLVELYSLSFFVLDEADRMIEKGHFHELQSIIDMLPEVQSHSSKSENFGGTQPLENDLRSNFIQENMNKNDEVNSNSQRKRRQTFVFSATIALTAGFRKKLKRGSHGLKVGTMNGNHSLAILSERAGVRENAAIVDLTSASIVAHKLEESVIECREQDKDAYLYYILKVHGCGRTIVFCTSIAALRRVSAILRILKVTVWPLHAQMQQRSRLKAMDRFRGNENCVLVATDVAARGLDIPGVRTIIHYQLPHSAEVYVHRSGRTARASSDGCSIALISPSDKSKFISLCNAFSKEGLPQFPVNGSYMPEVEKCVSIAIQIDRVSRKNSQTKAEKSWLTRNAEILEMDLEENESDKEEIRTSKPNKAELFRVKQLQQELDQLLQRPLQPKSLSHRFVAAAGMSTLIQQQLQEFTSAKRTDSEHRMPIGSKKQRFLVIGEETIEPLAALRNSTK